MRLPSPCVALGAVVAAAAAQAAGPPASSLRLAWTDGSRLDIRGKTYVWCGRWDDGTNVRTLRIQQGSPLAPPWLSLGVRLALGRRGHVIALPTLVGRTGTMFVAYPRRQLETSADSERSRGRVTILDDVTCRPGSQVRLAVSATLASEEAGGPSVVVRGTFTGRVGTTPAPGVQP